MTTKLTQLYTRGDERNPPRPLTEVELRRRVNMIMLIDDAGGQTPMSRKLGTANTSYLSQQISVTPHRVINEKSARKLEDVLGLQSGWMDSPQSRIIYASKFKSQVTDTPVHEHAVNESSTKYEVQLQTSVVDAQRLEECLGYVLPGAKNLSTNKVAKIVSALCESKARDSALVTLAETLISFSSED